MATSPASATPVSGVSVTTSPTPSGPPASATGAPAPPEAAPSVPTVEPLKGTTTVEGDPTEGQIIAYQAVNKIANDIAKTIAKTIPKLPDRPRQVVIHNDADVASLFNLQAFTAQLADVAARIENETKLAETLLNPPPGPPKVTKFAAPILAVAAQASGVLHAAIGLLSLFRTDITLKYQKVDIQDLALVAATSGALSAKGIEVYHPLYMPPQLADGQSQLLTHLDQAEGHFGDLQSTLVRVKDAIELAKAQIAKLTARIDAAAADLAAKQVAAADAAEAAAAAAPADKPAADAKVVAAKAAVKKAEGKIDQNAIETCAALTGRMKALTTIATQMEATVTAYTEFRKSLGQADEKTGTTALAKLVRAEKLRAVTANAHWLVLKLSAASGAVQTRNSLWGLRTKTLFSGGAVAQFLLFNNKGRVVAAGSCPAHIGFLRLREPWPCEAKDDLVAATTPPPEEP